MPRIPPIRRYGAGDPIHVTAQRVWLILVTLAQVPRLPDLPLSGRRSVPTITYGQLASAIGRSYLAGRTFTRELLIVGEYCLQNNLPCLNALVVTRFGECGEGVVTTNGRDPKIERKEIARQDWFEVGIPTTGTLRKVYADWLQRNSRSPHSK